MWFMWMRMLAKEFQRMHATWKEGDNDISGLTVHMLPILYVTNLQMSI